MCALPAFFSLESVIGNALKSCVELHTGFGASDEIKAVCKGDGGAAEYSLCPRVINPSPLPYFIVRLHNALFLPHPPLPIYMSLPALNPVTRQVELFLCQEASF